MCSHISGSPTSCAPDAAARSTRARARASLVARSAPELICRGAASTALDYHNATLVGRPHIFGAVAESGFRLGPAFCFFRVRAFRGSVVGRKEDILEKVRQIAAPLAAQEGMELIDVEFGGPGGR